MKGKSNPKIMVESIQQSNNIEKNDIIMTRIMQQNQNEIFMYTKGQIPKEGFQTRNNNDSIIAEQISNNVLIANKSNDNQKNIDGITKGESDINENIARKESANDAIIAYELNENQNDIDAMTKGKIDVQEFITNGNNLMYNVNDEGVTQNNTK